MADQVTFPTSIGGSGKTYTNDSNPDSGMFNGGHRINFFPILSDTVAAAGYVGQYAQAIDGAAANADRAENARGYVEGYAGALKNNILDYYRKKATLDLDFERGIYRVDNGTLTETTSPADLLTTVSRNTSKWVEGPDGLLHEIPSNTMARQWRRGVSQGLLIEGSQSNLALWSEDFTNAFWTKFDCSVVGDSTISPTGALSADTVTAEGSQSGIYSIHAVSEGEVYTGSVFLKSGTITTNQIRLAFYDITNSAFIAINVVGKIIELNNGWIRAEYTVTCPLGCNSIRFYPARVQTLDSGYYHIWGAHLGQEAVASSYIPTTDAVTTRGADSVRKTAGLSKLVDTNNFSCFVEGQLFSAEFNTLLRLDGSSGGPVYLGYTSNANPSQWYFSGFGAPFSPSIFTANVNTRWAFSKNGDQVVVCKDGAVFQQFTATAEIGDLVTLTLQNTPSGATRPGGLKKNVCLIPRALTTAELEELTA